MGLATRFDSTISTPVPSRKRHRVPATVKIGTGGGEVISTTVKSATRVDVVLGGYPNLPDGPRDVEVTAPDGTKQTSKGPSRRRSR